MVLLSERAKPNPSKKIMSNEFRLPGIVPWGRTAKEYEQFFRLQDLVPGARLLDCGGGPSSFASEYRERGFWAVSADPLFASSASAIEESFAQAIDIMMSGIGTRETSFCVGLLSNPRGGARAEKGGRDPGARRSQTYATRDKLCRGVPPATALCRWVIRHCLVLASAVPLQ